MDSFQSINLISDALLARGFSFERVRFDGHGYRLFRKGSKVWLTAVGYVSYPGTSKTTELIARQKDIAYTYVESLGFAVPQTLVVKPEDALGAERMGSLMYPLIIKPVAGTASSGVLRDIQDPRSLQAALDGVPRTVDVLVQQQFSGQEIRLTIMDGEVVSACLRAVPQLVGDGASNLESLLAEENAARRKLALDYITYPQLTPDLVSLPADMSAVPAKDEVVRLGAGTMISRGASVYDVHDQLDESYKMIARRIVQDLKVKFLVVDLLVSDYTQPATPENYVFLEFNTGPALKLYYSFRDGKHFDIVPRLAELIEANI